MKSIATNHRRALSEISSLDKELTNRFAEKLSVNDDLDRTLVSFQANRKENGHRWCKYKEGFSAALMRYVFRKLNIESGRIIDPFAGSGTALFAASELGLNSEGIELLPSSAEIVEVRRLIRNVDNVELVRRVRKFRQERSWVTRGPILPFKHLRITEGAFPGETEKQLSRYLYRASRFRDEAFARLLRFAALCVLESVSYTRKDGQYLRWDYRSGRRRGGKRFDKGAILPFTSAIEGKLDQIADDLEGELTLFDQMPSAKSAGAIELHVGSSLDILPELSSKRFDGLITSPPYCNRYDYTRTYALELAMLGIDEDGIRDLRQTMLSCTVENREKQDLDRRFANKAYSRAKSSFEGQELLNGILDYLEQCRRDRTLNNSGIPRMVRNYFWEMALVINECARILKEGAPLVMVNDNVRYQGAHVPVDLILSEFAANAGFDIDAIWVLPKGKGNSSQQMGVHGRQEIRKCVYVWRLSKVPQARKQDQQPAQVL